MKKAIIAALVVCTALGAVYMMTREKKVSVGIKTLNLPHVDVKNVTKVVFAGKENFVLQKNGANFNLVTAIGGEIRSVPASKEAMRQLYDAIQGVKSAVYITEAANKQEPMKVSEKSGQRVTLFANDKAVWDLIIGDYADDGGRYVRVPGEAAIFLGKARFWDITRGHVNDFRERMIVGVDADAMSSVRLEDSSSERGIARNDKGLWAFDEKTAPVMGDIEAQKDKALDFANAAATLRVSAFVDAPDRMRKVKALLNSSEERLVVVPKNGEPIVVALAQGSEAGKAYARVEGQDSYYEISDFAYARLHPKAEGVVRVPTAAEIPRGVNGLPPGVREKLQEAIRERERERGESQND